MTEIVQPTDQRVRGPAVVTCQKVCKRYGDFHALIDCSLEVLEGDSFGLLGPNGAGKTTLIRSLLGYLNITGGESRVCGLDPRRDPVAVRRVVSYLPGDARLPRHMRGEGVLRFFADLHPEGDFARSRHLAGALELDTRRHVGMMSTGMRQKLALAVVLAPRTPLLILDEPTANLDPSVRSTVLQLVAEARREGRTVMFSSHVMSEIEESCNRVVFLRRGRVARELEMAELFQKHRVWADVPTDGVPSDRDAFADTIRNKIPPSLAGRVRVRAFEGGPTGSIVIDTEGDLAPMLGWIDSLRLRRIRIEPLGLRAVYDSVHHGGQDDPRDSERAQRVSAELPVDSSEGRHDHQTGGVTV